MLAIMTLRGGHAVLHDFMKVKGYITDAAFAEVTQLLARGDPLSSHPRSTASPQILENITEPFILDLAKSMECIVVLQEEAIVYYRFRTRRAVTGDNLRHSKQSPYSGNLPQDYISAAIAH